MFALLKKSRNLSLPMDIMLKIVTFFKLYIILYADDTVILAENPNDLQASLDEMKKYCDTFDLHINVNKTKILIFSRGKLRRHQYF